MILVLNLNGPNLLLCGKRVECFTATSNIPVCSLILSDRELKRSRLFLVASDRKYTVAMCKKKSNPNSVLKGGSWYDFYHLIVTTNEKEWKLTKVKKNWNKILKGREKSLWVLSVQYSEAEFLVSKNTSQHRYGVANWNKIVKII